MKKASSLLGLSVLIWLSFGIINNADAAEVKLAKLHSSVATTGSETLRNELNQLTTRLETELSAGKRDSAAHTLREIAVRAFKGAEEEKLGGKIVPLMTAIVDTQKEYKLSSGTTLHSNRCCQQTGSGKGKCKRNKGTVCVTIDTLPGQCSGFPCL